MSNRYDVIIIGAGIGGLVCGCYLAKAGLKVLIVEQHDKPGGYCTSFERDGYRFDVGVHYLGSFKKGILRKAMDDLELDLSINRIDPVDKIIMPDSTVYIRNNLKDTIEEFKKSFPKESKNIENFFQFMFQKDFMTIYSKIKKNLFKELLDNFFNSYKLKSILTTQLGNLGLSANTCSAPVGICLFRMFVFNSGYYPNGGIQRFPDALANKFLEFGGELMLSCKVRKILTKKNKIEGIGLFNEKKIKAKIVVSNADATLTFKELLDIQNTEEYAIVDKLTVSPSAFKVYLGLEKDIRQILRESCNIWYFSSYEIDKIYSGLLDNYISSIPKYFICNFPSIHDTKWVHQNKSTVEIFINTPFLSKTFWSKNKESFSEKIIAEVEKHIFPSLKNIIKVKIIATPITFERYTFNRKGAIFGWASTVAQTNNPPISSKTSIDGLYLVGHWSCGRLGQGGIPGVTFSGTKVASQILESMNKKLGGAYKFYEYI